MADIEISYSLTDACAGGGHYRLIASVTGLGATRQVRLDVPELSEVPENDQLREALETLTWLLAKKYLANLQASSVSALLDSKKIVLLPVSQ